jgi:beta-lactamase superfamily II metal-dependent hydrolase
MRFEQLNESSCKTYLVAEGDAAMLVDPLLGHEDRYLALLAEAGLRLRVVLDTHVHADHLSGCAALRDRTGADHAVHASSQAEAASRRVDACRTASSPATSSSWARAARGARTCRAAIPAPTGTPSKNSHRCPTSCWSSRATTTAAAPAAPWASSGAATRACSPLPGPTMWRCCRA